MRSIKKQSIKISSKTGFCASVSEKWRIAFDLYGSISQFQAPTKFPGTFFEVVKSPAPGQNFCAKARPRGKKSTYARGISSQPFLLIGVEILEFCRNQTLNRIEKLSNYSLLIPLHPDRCSFSLSTIFYHSKVSPQLYSPPQSRYFIHLLPLPGAFAA